MPMHNCLPLLNSRRRKILSTSFIALTFVLWIHLLPLWAQTSASTTTTLPPIYERYFPIIVNNDSLSTGIAVVNLSSSPATLTFKAYSNTGVLLASNQRILAPNSQLALLIGEIFPRLGNAPGWMLLESSAPNVEGFFLQFDPDLTVMDGATVSDRLFRNFVLPTHDDGELSLTNKINTPMTCILQYVSESGSAGPLLQFTVPSLARITQQLSSFRSSGDSGGYLRGRSDGIVALAAAGKPGWFALVEPYEIKPKQALASPNIMYAPQYAIGGGFVSVLDIISLDSSALPLSLKLIGDDGSQIGTTGSVVLPPQGGLRLGPAVFGIMPGSHLVQGYVQIQSSGGQFAGWIRFSDAAEQIFGTELQFMSEGLTTAYFSHVTQNEQFYTGLAAINPNPQAAIATITVYNTRGDIVATGTRQIPPGGRFSKILPELVGLIPPLTKGFFALTSSLPVMSIAVFGTNSGNVLAAISPQSIATTTMVTTTTSITNTTTTLPSSPMFNPMLTLTISSLTAGTIPTIACSYFQEAGELNVRAINIQLAAGRVDLANLPVGKILGSFALIIPGLGTSTLEHVVVSNTGTGVTTVFRTQLFGTNLIVAEGLYENVGAEGIRLLITISNPIPFSDGSTTNTPFSFRFFIDSVYILPTQAGRTFTVTTTLTSVLPSTGGPARSGQWQQIFTTTP